MNTTIVCIVIPIVLIVAILVIQTRARSQREEALIGAKSAYQSALGKLKERPSDPDRRQRALEAGRTYSSLTRENKGVTVFDEIALKNDLDAATAGAAAFTATVAPVATPAPTPTVAAPTLQDRLRKLEDLKAQGLITEDEYQVRRAKLLDEV